MKILKKYWKPLLAACVVAGAYLLAYLLLDGKQLEIFKIPLQNATLGDLFKIGIFLSLFNWVLNKK